MKLLHTATLLLASAASCVFAGSSVCDDGAATTQTPAPTTQTPAPTTQTPAPTTQTPAPTTQTPVPTTPAPTTLLPPQSQGWANFTSSDGLTVKSIFVQPNNCYKVDSCISQHLIKDGWVDWSAFGGLSYIFVYPSTQCSYIPSKNDYTALSAGVMQRANWTTATMKSFAVVHGSTPVGELSRYLDQCPQGGRL